MMEINFKISWSSWFVVLIMKLGSPSLSDEFWNRHIVNIFNNLDPVSAKILKVCINMYIALFKQSLGVFQKWESNICYDFFYFESKIIREFTIQGKYAMFKRLSIKVFLIC